MENKIGIDGPIEPQQEVPDLKELDVHARAQVEKYMAEHPEVPEGIAIQNVLSQETKDSNQS